MRRRDSAGYQRFDLNREHAFAISLPERVVVFLDEILQRVGFCRLSELFIALILIECHVVISIPTVGYLVAAAADDSGKPV